MPKNISDDDDWLDHTPRTFDSYNERLDGVSGDENIDIDSIFASESESDVVYTREEAARDAAAAEAKAAELDRQIASQRPYSLTVAELYSAARSQDERLPTKNFGIAFEEAVAKAKPNDGMQLLEVWLVLFNSPISHDLSGYNNLFKLASKVVSLAYACDLGVRDGMIKKAANHQNIIKLLDQYIDIDGARLNDPLRPLACDFVGIVDRYSSAPPLQRSRYFQKLPVVIEEEPDESEQPSAVPKPPPRAATSIVRSSNELSTSERAALRQQARNNRGIIPAHHGNSDDLLALMRASRPADPTSNNTAPPSPAPGKNS